MRHRHAHAVRAAAAAAALGLVLAACGADETDDTVDTAAVEDAVAATGSSDASSDASSSASDEDAAGAAEETFTASVWADNWFALYVDGVLVAEDSVPITTERSFNQETFTFTASRPFTIAIEAKDFKESDSGLEYIGEQNQQMGDGGIIAQVTAADGTVVAATDGDWSALVVHRAPLDPACEDDVDPDATCTWEIVAAPDAWTEAGFDDGGWPAAATWSEAAVSPKDGYDEVAWDPSAALVWGADLEIDNTVLLRTTVD